MFPFFAVKADYTNGKGNGLGYGHYKDKHDDGHEGKSVPIDGGISLLIVAGATLGAARVFKKNQKNIPDA